MSDDDWDDSKICSTQFDRLSKYRIKIDDDKSMDINDVVPSVSECGVKMETIDTLPATRQNNGRESKTNMEPWMFPACERNISSFRSECYYCQPRQMPGFEIKKLKPWFCEKCGAFVIGSTNQCYCCLAAKTADCREVKYRPKSDWICKNCGVNVFPSRSVCFLCDTPRMA